MQSPSSPMSMSEHIVIFPFMAKGHTIPLLHLSSHLSSSHPSLLITLISTPSNLPFLRQHLPNNPNIHILLLPFPHFPPLPPNCESTDSLPSFYLFPLFLAATSLLRAPFDALFTQLTRSSPPPLCLISDFFLFWTLDICNRLSIPRIVFHGMSTFSMLACKSIWTQITLLNENVNDNGDGDGDDKDDDVIKSFHVPGTPDTLIIKEKDIPEDVLKSADPNDPGSRLMAEIGESDVNSWGVLVNSFEDLEGEYVKPFEAFYQNGARAWLVGPMCLYSHDDQNLASGDDTGCLQWLDQQEENSVVYVSFGTQAQVSDEQLDEVFFGLAESECKFIWAVRSVTWVPPATVSKSEGMIVKWSPQTAVLQHKATGGFVSHCGWNSVVEGVSAGVAMLAWPMIAEQNLNAKMVVEVLGAGITGGARDEGEVVVGRERVREGVRELMVGGMGRRARERAAELGRKARMSVEEGGSSRLKMEELIEELRRFRDEKRQLEDKEADASLQFEFRKGIQIA